VEVPELPFNALTFNGRHHEIYLNDPPKLRTILRRPVTPQGKFIR
jgi:hypothetical protein